jgi:integrase
VLGCARPQERNPRRPVASEERFQRTLAQCDAVDPSGRLRCMLALARYTGRRENAICHLRASDVLLTRDAVLGALAALGLDERLADHMPHGAIRWRPEADKRGYANVTAIGPAARAALDAYLVAQPRVGDAWLFPAVKDDTRPIGRGVAGDWLVRAERRAKLPKLDRGRWHPYRGLFATERKHLPDVDVAEAAGWRDLRTMKRSYQQPDPAAVLKVVESAPGGHTSDTPQSATNDRIST